MNLTDFLQEHNVTVAPQGHHHETPNRIQIDCPQCSPNSGRFRLGIHLSYLGSSCWSCGKINVINALAEVTGLHWSEVKKKLDGLDRSNQRQEKHSGKLILPKGLRSLLPVHKEYLIGRGFNPDELVRLWNIQGIGMEANLAWRIFIPVESEGKTVSWTTRSLVDDGLRYISADPSMEAIPLKSLVYGSDYIRHAAICCEGPLDVMNVGPGCLGTFGLSVTAQQVAKIARIPLRVIVFDNEPQAQQRATRLAEQLAPFPGKTVVINLDAADPGSASKKEVQRIRRLYLE